MIKLSKYRTSLLNLPVTLNALEELEALIAYYSEDKPGPAYLKACYLGGGIEFQLDRKFMLEALESQRRKLIDYLAGIGIDYEG